MDKSSTCTAVVEGIPCRRKSRSRGLCSSHYRHWREYGALRLLWDQGVADGEKRCTYCRQVKTLAEFNRARIGRGGVMAWCKQCCARHSEASRFGVHPGWRDATWTAQAGRCGICSREIDARTSHIDHDHTTGRVRGLLCTGCNTIEGRLPEGDDAVRQWAERFIRWRKKGA